LMKNAEVKSEKWRRRAWAVAVLLAGLMAVPPSGTGFDFKKLRPSADKKLSASQPTGVAGVRGLDEPGEEGDLSARDPEALAWLEAQPVSPDDLKTFQSSGGLKKAR